MDPQTKDLIERLARELAELADDDDREPTFRETRAAWDLVAEAGRVLGADPETWPSQDQSLGLTGPYWLAARPRD